MTTFKIPDGFEIPPDAEDEFTVVAKVKRDGEGSLTLLEIDGSKLPGADKKESPKPKGDSEGETMMARWKNRPSPENPMAP